MFTGLIEKDLEIIYHIKNSTGAIIKIDCPFCDEIKVGDSISVNGACLTVAKKEGRNITLEISNETLRISNLNNIKIGDRVNIERAMLANSRIDGHIVTGHIDGTGTIKSIKEDGFSYDICFNCDNNISKYIIKKGSIAINGISLTVKEVKGNSFSVEVIPHTFKNTNLSSSRIGDIVNIETDILGRYIEKFTILNNSNNEKISVKMLEENGYL